MTVRQLAFFGDSLTAGTVGNFSYGEGGQGIWAQLVADQLSNIVGLGPLVSSGFIGCILSSEYFGWSFSAGWSDTTAAHAWDVAPYGVLSASGSLSLSKYGNGSTKTVTFTASKNLRYPNVGFTLYCVDYTNGGNWSYRINAGTWIAMGQSLSNDNKILKFHIATPLSLGDTVSMRCADAAGTGVGCAPIGIEVFYQSPASANGLVVHNVAPGGSRLHDLCETSTAGDRLAWLKSAKVRVGTNAISHIPDLGCVVMHINDAGRNNTTDWATDLTAFFNAASALGPVGFLSPWETNTTDITPTVQGNYRTQTKTSVTGFGGSAKLLDLYDQWLSNGIMGNAATYAVGYVLPSPDFSHESQAGHREIAQRVYWWLRTQFLSSYTGPSTYTATASQSAKQYKGKAPAVQYAARVPIGIR